MNILCKSMLLAIIGGSISLSAMAALPPAPQANAPHGIAPPVAPAPQPNGSQGKAVKDPQRNRNIEAQNAALFQQSDANKDGKLSATEFARFNQLKQAAWQARKQQDEQNRFARLDTNKDGGLSPDELKAAHPQRAHFKHGPDGLPQPPKPVI